MSAGAVIVGKAAGLTVIVLETGARVLPQASVVVQVSVTVPPQAPGVVVKVEGLDVPFIRQPPLNPLLKLIVVAAGIAPQATVILAGAVIVGKAAGLTAIVLDTGARVLPQASVAVQVSVTVPPQAPGVVVKVEGLDVPLIRQPPLSPLLKLIVFAAGIAPQATVMSAGAVIVGKAAGLTVIVLETGARVLPQSSVAVHVSVTNPPQVPGVAVKLETFEVPVFSHPPVNPFE
jgi:glycine cleavage system regulatory protein